ncbi:hypothetical protein BCR37DRAFT_393188 [Protomyces lactucae-debilis]|uniref:Uncharacterized protein n=1 Tax=Protomyces lactucae-debilis TaxID=2754530 RepID=A0A1Y2FE20_PROLT|nr:uncharacterized protein BCR37DRAFT_393188 [Protomyces lactucae-debilis]ORY82159.1 hypothetical protein BCR37DRAFT_393188 [Protomyces lactucae-debilis]
MPVVSRPRTAYAFWSAQAATRPTGRPATAPAAFKDTPYTRIAKPSAPSGPMHDVKLSLMHPRHRQLLAPIACHSDYNEAEAAIVEIILPTLQERCPGTTFAMSIVQYKSHPTILVGVSEPEGVRQHLSTTYGGLPVLIVQARTETRDAAIDLDLVRRTADKAAGASLGSLGSDHAGTLGMFVRHKSSKAICGLTAYHVVSSNDEVLCPAEADALPLINHLEPVILHLQTVVRQKNSRGRDSREEQQVLDTLKEDLSKLLNRSTFGRVIAKDFQVPSEDNPVYSDCALFTIDRPDSIELRRFQKTRADNITKFVSPADVHRNDVLTMIGRTSGKTKANKNEYRFVSSMTLHTGVKSKPFFSWSAWNEHSDFTAKGDSGAVVVRQGKELYDNAAIGIVVGGTRMAIPSDFGTRECDITFFQPITEAAELLGFEVIDDD